MIFTICNFQQDGVGFSRNELDKFLRNSLWISSFSRIYHQINAVPWHIYTLDTLYLCFFDYKPHKIAKNTGTNSLIYTQIFLLYFIGSQMHQMYERVGALVPHFIFFYTLFLRFLHRILWQKRELGDLGHVSWGFCGKNPRFYGEKVKIDRIFRFPS